MDETTEISHAKTRKRKEETQTLHPLVELTLMRMREFLREKEAVFWVFIFPVLMTFALGIAFRNTGPDKTLVAVEAGDPKATEIADVLSRSPDISASVLNPEQATQALRSGKVSIVVKSTNDALEYRFDPTRPESRSARLLVDDVLQRGKGRTDVVSVGDQRITEPGARYVDFLVPGLIGMNLMGSGLWGLGFTVVIARSRKLLKRFAATPMRRSHYLLSFMLSRLARGPFEPAANRRFREVFDGHRGPFVVKPVSGRVSLHVRVVDHAADLGDAVAEVYAATENHVLIEAYLPGREFCVAVCGPVSTT